MMNQKAGLAGLPEPSTAGIQNFETISMPTMRMFIEKNSGMNVMRRDFR